MPIKPVNFYKELANHNVDFFTGVPDSLLKEFCLCLDDYISKKQHVITANEGNAIALATGYHLATNKIPLVYMQNSGLGNAINPLLSLCDPEVYGIPLLVLIGWRGEKKINDEPQHIKQGKIQTDLLDAMDIPFEVIPNDSTQYKSKIENAIRIAKNKNVPVVLLIKKGTFSQYVKNIDQPNNKQMLREEALEIILEKLDNNAIIVSTTGKTSREIFEIREKTGESHQQDFLTVGSMGHCSSIALGIALAKPHRQVICIDGDGSMLMHLGSLTSIASLKPTNFHHILLNNRAHESVGGQPTAAKEIDLSAIIKALGTIKIFKAQTYEELKANTSKFIRCCGPSFLEVEICSGSRKDLGRPTIKPSQNKKSFMRFLEK